jgi:starch phosphorylase
MRPIFTFTVVPAIPERLKRLSELAYNLVWCWDHETIDLFRRIDRDLWEEVYHNPVKLLGAVRQERLMAVAEDDGFLAHYDRVCQKFDNYMWSTTWYQKTYSGNQSNVIAYFSAEFGITESLPSYSGGLGILAGDHLKSASDLGIPLVGVGLQYQQGFFRQYLNIDGWQQERFPLNDFYTLPNKLETREDGTPVKVKIEFPKGPVWAQVWRIQVGRVPLFLLDTNLPENKEKEYRDISDQLYGGDQEMRIRQEILLGIGGLRALHEMGIKPTVCHMNEGHSAFLALERVRLLMETARLSFEEAREATSISNVFTTHTPVRAGMDYFPPELMDAYLSGYYSQLGLTRDEFLALGRQNPDDPKEYFSMPILAIKLSSYLNGVSRFHGAVSRKLWANIWPGLPTEEVPIVSITNGVHIRSWISQEMADLYDRYLGPRWKESSADQTVWQRVDQIPSEELWRTHERRRERLVAFARRRLKAQYEQQGAMSSEISKAQGVLDPEALTIGFARRFATYKRATLLFRDVERLKQILCDKARPLQIIFSGKAHPRDNEGKEFIRQIVHHARKEEFRRHVVFLEDYDITIARCLVQGVDVWLNTPRRGLEASGTSGMKAAANGAINMSILDGWWHEAYRAEVGWAIGREEEYDDYNYQDDVESNAIYNLLEKELAPLFYDRGPDGLPHGWISRMKQSMRFLCPVFNTNRMVHEYTTRLYQPAAERHARMEENGMGRVKTLAAWKKKIRENWDSVEVMKVEPKISEALKAGVRFDVEARLKLGSLNADDVLVQLYHGPINPEGEIVRGRAITMKFERTAKDGTSIFLGTCPCRSSGLYGYSLRILPMHEDLTSPFETRLVQWAE